MSRDLQAQSLAETGELKFVTSSHQIKHFNKDVKTTASR